MRSVRPHDIGTSRCPDPVKTFRPCPAYRIFAARELAARTSLSISRCVLAWRAGHDAAEPPCGAGRRDSQTPAQGRGARGHAPRFSLHRDRCDGRRRRGCPSSGRSSTRWSRRPTCWRGASRSPSISPACSPARRSWCGGGRSRSSSSGERRRCSTSSSSRACSPASAIRNPNSASSRNTPRTGRARSSRSIWCWSASAPISAACPAYKPDVGRDRPDLAGRLFLPLPRLEIRSRRPRLQGRAGAAQPARAALSTSPATPRWSSARTRRARPFSLSEVETI